MYLSWSVIVRMTPRCLAFLSSSTESPPPSGDEASYFGTPKPIFPVVRGAPSDHGSEVHLSIPMSSGSDRGGEPSPKAYAGALTSGSRESLKELA